MNNVRLVCGGVSVDLPSDFGILINKSIADIREPESRSSDWSKTFTLPGTKANNKLFTHLFDLNLSIRNTSATNFNPDFNPNLKADAILQVDEVTQIQGFIRLLGIKINDFNQIEYECSMHGELADLFAKVADAKLADLDFSEYNHIMSDTNIFNSWNTSIIKNSSGYVNFSGGSPIGDGYVYGWMNDGTYAHYKELNADKMTINLYAKTIVDKIFSGAGYTYSSGSFFNSAQFKRLVVPCPSNFPPLTQSKVNDFSFFAESASGVTYLPGDKIAFTNEITDPTNQYNTTTSTFTNQHSGQRYRFVFDIDATVTVSSPAPNSVNLKYSFYFNGKKTFELGTSFTPVVGANNITASISMTSGKLPVGTTIDVRLEAIQDENGQTISPTYTQNAGSAFYNYPIAAYGYNETVFFDGFFQQTEVKQREFMRWIFSLFNLYIQPSGVKNELTIMPRDEFYTNNVRDWTQKRDLSQPLEIIPMGELDAVRYQFTYAEGEDNGNKFYKDDYNRIYGDREINIINDFVKETKKIEIGFQPTLIIRPELEADKYLPDNDKERQTNNNTKLRLLQYKYLSCQPYKVWLGTKGAGVSSTTKTNYPFMGHLDDPLASTTDINFGLPRYIGLPAGTAITNNNAFNAYWSKGIQEISDKDSKIVKGKFYITPADMEKLSFRDLYFFDNNYFRLNKIEDYDPINPSVNICEFLFLKSGVTFTATTGSVGGGGTQSSGGGSGQEEYDPWDGADLPGKVIRNKGIGIGDFNQAGDGVMVGNNFTNFGLRNAAFASSGVTFSGDDSIVIGEAPTSEVGSDEIWLQGHLMTQENFTTNRIELTTATTVTADLYKDIYIMDCTANTTLNLPDATTCLSKAYYVYKNTSAHSLTIDPYEAQTIDDGATYVITGHYECVQIVSDGTQWRVISKK
jgi:hypothetical protein